MFWPALAAAQIGGRPMPQLPEPAGLAEVFQRDELTGLALSGLDPITFFLPGGPKPGRAELQVVWAGVAWRFPIPLRLGSADMMRWPPARSGS
jgi:hypothetical protein